MIVLPTVIEHASITPSVHHTATASQPASVTVQIAEGATLTVDGQVIALNGTNQTFNTPSLDSKRIYYYEMKASQTRDGQKFAASRRVQVQAGQSISVDLRELKVEGPAPVKPEPVVEPTPKADGATARLTIKLPAEARLFVDGVQAPTSNGVSSFETPPLQPGKKFYYTLKAEVKTEGRTTSETKKVTFEAGKQVTVEFKNLANEMVSR